MELRCRMGFVVITNALDEDCSHPFLLVLSEVLGWGDDGSGRRVPEVACGGVVFAREVLGQIL